jgi:signal transduction histidine kinase
MVVRPWSDGSRNSRGYAGQMAVSARRSLIRRVPPGAWAAGLWCLGTAYSVRGYTGLASAPRFYPPLVAGAWPLIAAATAAAVAGGRLLRRRPLLALGLLIAGSFAVALAVRSAAITTLHFAGIDVAFGFVMATGRRRTRIAAAVITLAVLPGFAETRLLLGMTVRVSNVGSSGSTLDWLALALIVIAGLIGNSVRQAREYAQRLSARTAAAAVTGERLRISRELHDMVAHSIGIIALQAGAAARVIDTQPEGARQAMIAVETTSRETLAGLRRLLGALREGELGTEPAPLQPAPGLADVGQLATATTAAGVRVDVHWHGERRPLPPDIDQSAYRIIQESVTNVVRHAGAPSCKVYITYVDEALSIEVTDRGQGGAGDAGFGLAGMRERVALLHGEFTAGPRPGGGFGVLARVPVPQPARAR